MQWFFQLGASLPSGGHLAMSREISGCDNEGWGWGGGGDRRKVLLAFSGWRPGRLLNIPKHPTIHKTAPHKKEPSDKNVSSAGADER